MTLMRKAVLAVTLLGVCLGVFLVSRRHDDCISPTSTCCHARIYSLEDDANSETSDYYSDMPVAAYGSNEFSFATSKGPSPRVIIANGRWGKAAAGQAMSLVQRHGTGPLEVGQAALEYQEAGGANDVNHWDLTGGFLFFKSVHRTELSFDVKGARAAPGLGDHNNGARGSFKVDLSCRIIDVTLRN